MAFVYAHKRKTDDTTFYIGKGSYFGNNGCGRHKVTGDRNKHWHNVANKHGWYSEILMDDLTDDEAFELEMFVIETIGMDNLCNYTKGGDQPPNGGAPKGNTNRKGTGKLKNFSDKYGIPYDTVIKWATGKTKPHKNNKNRWSTYLRVVEMVNQGKTRY